MQIQRIIFAGGILVALAATVSAQPKDVIYEGARLIVGDASAPIENGAFVVRNGHITAIGPKGSIQAPAGAVSRRSDRQDRHAHAEQHSRPYGIRRIRELER